MADMQFIHRPWTKQPPPGTEIDWLNPLTRGLVFAAPTADGRDAVTGAWPVTIRANNEMVPETMGRFGPAIASASPGGTTNCGRLYLDHYAHAQCFGKPGFTMWSLQLSRTGDTWEMPFCVDFDVASTNPPRRVGYQGSSGNSNPNYAIGYSDVTGTRVSTTPSIWPANELSTMAMRFDRTKATDRLEFFVNGQVGHSNDAQDKAVGWTSESGSETIILNDSDETGTNDNFDGPVALALMWSRAITDAEIRALEQNPWQIFKPKIIFVGKPDDRRVVVF